MASSRASSLLLVFVAVYGVVSGGQAPTLKLNDGRLIPAVALGTGRGTSPEHADVSEVRTAVRVALEAGYRQVDTAAIYGDETEVGQGISDFLASGTAGRGDIFVTTKLWNDRHAKDQVVPALRESLKRLGLDYVDLYLIHFPLAFNADDTPANIDYLETWQGMEEARRLGLAKSIGVSNFNQQQLERLLANSQTKPVVNEIEVNPTLTQQPLVKYCQDNDIVVMAYSPFGFLVTRDAEHSPPPHLDDPQLLAMANKYNKTVPQISLRYLAQRGLVPIPKSVTKKRIEQNIDIFDFQLTFEEMCQIDAFNKDIRVIDIPDWQNHPDYPFKKSL